MRTLLAFLFVVVALPARAEDAALPGDGYQAARYETLWTKSPFSVATPDAVDASPDYTLVGVTVLEGVSYASIVDAHSGDHFIISSQKDTKGLKISSINRGADGKDTYATVLKDGQPLTLKLATQPVATGGAPGVPTADGNIPAPGIPPPAPVVQNIPMPGAGNAASAPIMPGVTRPFTRLHRSPIHLPPVPPQQAAPQGQPGGGAPAQNGASPNGAPLQPHVVPPQ